MIHIKGGYVLNLQCLHVKQCRQIDLFTDTAAIPKVFLSFLLEDKTSVHDVLRSFSFIPRAHFESSSVMVNFHG